MKKESIIIIGGGIAGLVAADELADRFDILLLEASDRLGGRIHNHDDTGFSHYIETGAEFIHGHCKETLHLLDRAGLEFKKVSGQFLRHEKGKWVEQHEMIKGWDQLLETMGTLKTDMTLAVFLQQYYGQPGQEGIRQQVRSFAEGFDVADPEKVSVKWLYEEWSAEEEDNFRITGGYGALTRFLAKELEQCGVRVQTGSPVYEIDWKPGEVIVHTKDKKKYTAQKAIVTVPVSLLEHAGNSSIRFLPGIDAYIEAAGKIGMGGVIKIILEFREAFWKRDTGFILSDEIVPTWWTQLPDNTPVLTGWMGGPRASRLSAATEKEILDKAILSLASIFDLPAASLNEQLKASMVIDWQKNEWSLGAYTYDTPSSKSAKQLLNTAVSDTLFFAGEGLYEGKSPGTVEAAIAHAKETAKKIRKE